MITIDDLINWKINKKKFAAITAYDATFARFFYEKCNIKVMLVGDSLGMTIKGQNSTIPVTIDDMVYHTSCVRKGSSDCLLLADLPSMSYNTLKQALYNSEKLIKVGANIIKVEGGNKWLRDIIYDLNERSIPICGHLGITPQHVNMFGKYKIQGKSKEDAENILNNALELEKNGIKLLILECVDLELAKKITNSLEIPVIGIGSGPYTDGQILVMHDVLGISGTYTPSFAKEFLSENISSIFRKYVKSVENNTFPKI